jgi:hypothetical protein
MDLTVAVYSSVLFFLLVPSVLVRLPETGSKYVVALVHAVIFGILLYFTSSQIESLFSMEGFSARSRKLGESCGWSSECKQGTCKNKKCA